MPSIPANQTTTRSSMTKAELDAVTIGGARPHGDVIRLVGLSEYG